MEWTHNFVLKPFWFTWITFLMLILWLPIGFVVPEHWGWENGPIENAQFVFLFYGMFASWRASRTYSDDPTLKKWWLWSIGAWLLIIGREISWGRNLFPYSLPGEEPLFYKNNELWFGPYIHLGVFIVIVVLVVGLMRNFSYEKVKATVRIPVWDAIAFFVSFLGLTMFEDGKIDVPTEYNMRMEEIGELIAYWCLANIVFLNGFKPEVMPPGTDVATD